MEVLIGQIFHTPVGGNAILSGLSTIRVEYAISDFKNADSNYVLYAAFANSAAKLGGCLQVC